MLLQPLISWIKRDSFLHELRELEAHNLDLRSKPTQLHCRMVLTVEDNTSRSPTTQSHKTLIFVFCSRQSHKLTPDANLLLDSKLIMHFSQKSVAKKEAPRFECLGPSHKKGVQRSNDQYSFRALVTKAS